MRRCICMNMYKPAHWYIVISISSRLPTRVVAQVGGHGGDEAGLAEQLLEDGGQRRAVVGSALSGRLGLAARSASTACRVDVAGQYLQGGNTCARVGRIIIGWRGMSWNTGNCFSFFYFQAIHSNTEALNYPITDWEHIMETVFSYVFGRDEVMPMIISLQGYPLLTSLGCKWVHYNVKRIVRLHREITLWDYIVTALGTACFMQITQNRAVFAKSTFKLLWKNKLQPQFWFVKSGYKPRLYFRENKVF